MDKKIVKFILNWDRIFPTNDEQDTEPIEGYNRDDDFVVDLRYQTYESQLDLENDNVLEHDFFVAEDPNMVEIIGDTNYFKFRDEIYPTQVRIIKGKLYTGWESPGKDEDVFDWDNSFLTLLFPIYIVQNMKLLKNSLVIIN